MSCREKRDVLHEHPIGSLVAYCYGSQALTPSAKILHDSRHSVKRISTVKGVRDGPLITSALYGRRA